MRVFDDLRVPEFGRQLDICHYASTDQNRVSLLEHAMSGRTPYGVKNVDPTAVVLVDARLGGVREHIVVPATRKLLAHDRALLEHLSRRVRGTPRSHHVVDVPKCTRRPGVAERMPPHRAGGDDGERIAPPRKQPRVAVTVGSRRDLETPLAGGIPDRETKVA